MLTGWLEEHRVIALRNLPHTPEHNPWIEHGFGELKAETGLGKNVRIPGETGSDAVLYVNIANAKWRTTDKADQGEVLAVHAVKEMIRANKALLLTSTDFTAGARGLAAQHNIGLHVVRPTFDHARIPLGDRSAMRASITALAVKPYTFEVVHRGLDLAERPAPVVPAPRPSRGYTTRQVTSYTTREGPGPGFTHRSIGGGGAGPTGPGRSSGGGGFTTRDGGGRRLHAGRWRV